MQDNIDIGPLTADKKNPDKQLPNDKKDIKNYMNNKRMLSKKLTDENKLLERERKMIIENRLRSLAQKVKVSDKLLNSDGKNVRPTVESMPIEHYRKEWAPEKSKKEPENNYKRSADDVSIDSAILSKSISEYF